MTYTFKQTWTKEDYVAFATNHLLINFFKVQNFILYFVSIGYLLITPLLTGKFTFFFIGLGLLAMMGFYILYARRAAGKGYEKNKDLLSISFVLNEEGLTYVTTEGEMTEPWAQFYSVKETKDYFFMYFTAQKGFLLAKRDLTEPMKNFIVKMFDEHMTNRRRVKLMKK